MGSGGPCQGGGRLRRLQPVPPQQRLHVPPRGGAPEGGDRWCVSSSGALGPRRTESSSSVSERPRVLSLFFVNVYQAFPRRSSGEKKFQKKKKKKKKKSTRVDTTA